MRDQFRNRFGSEDELDDLPDHALLGVIRMPERDRKGPWNLIARRLGYAVAMLLIAAIAVYLDRDGYSERLAFVDSLYYASVSLSTTGYGDIAPVTERARIINILLITPLRVVFLALLVGTTLTVLTQESRRALQIQRWRNQLRNHTVVIGYGTKGRSAISALLADGVDPSQIVVVDIASVRESENRHLLAQSGADQVVISSETAGRMLGLATVTPSVVEMMEDLLSPDEGFSVAERLVTEEEIGANPRHLSDIALGVVRSGELYRIDAPECESVEPGDRLLYVRRVFKEDDQTDALK